MLQIKNLTVKVDSKIIIEDLTLFIKKGEIHVLLGPNASGKSSLAQTIMGNPRYQILQGKIWFKDQDITRLSMEKRAQLGLALSFQEPPPIKGVSLNQILELIRQKRGHKIKKTKQTEIELLEQLPASKKLLHRNLNERYSGGEKKIAELLQLSALKPKLIIFDELDSGLDIKNLSRILKVIKAQFLSKGVSVLFITHHGQIVDGMQPDWTHVMLNKKIICNSQDYQKVITTIKEHGYQKCRHCQFVDR
ncbi:MAG: Fe-S cluster assembly ATPase SufC [Patescibacteria group bacterium]|nr:Fe-S cluster assembly ATPase SufC [Patescibacteria group bacterium]